MAETSVSWLFRSLATRIMSALPPRKGATTALSLNTIRAVGREKRANRIPVARAKPMRPRRASTATTALAAVPCGVMRP